MRLLPTIGLFALLLPVASARAAPAVFAGALNGANESPATGSPGTGVAQASIDVPVYSMVVTATFSGLQGTTTAAHIHCCTSVPNSGTAGVATVVPSFSNFPLGVSAGTYSNFFDMSQSSSYNSAFVSANGGSVLTAYQALLKGLAEERAYFNIHTTSNPGGEIRSFLREVPIFANGFDL